MSREFKHLSTEEYQKIVDRILTSKSIDIRLGNHILSYIIPVESWRWNLPFIKTLKIITQYIKMETSENWFYTSRFRDVRNRKYHVGYPSVVRHKDTWIVWIKPHESEKEDITELNAIDY